MKSRNPSLPPARGERPARPALAGFAVAAGLALAAALTAPPASLAAESQPERVAVGQEAPDFTLDSSHGQTYALGQLRGGEKHLVLVFFRGSW